MWILDLIGREDPPLATWSPCGRYRYTLRRPLTVKPHATMRCIAWVLLNPSTATETEDDPTIRRVQGFSRAWGYSEAVIVNVYALRSTDPKGLWQVDDPVGPGNDAAIAETCARAETVVAAWGVNAKPERIRRVMPMLGHAPMCLGTTKSGAPRHPLYVPSTTQLVRFGEGGT